MGGAKCRNRSSEQYWFSSITARDESIQGLYARLADLVLPCLTSSPLLTMAKAPALLRSPGRASARAASREDETRARAPRKSVGLAERT